MNLEKYKDKEILMITPDSEKINILNKFISDNKLYNIKFMTIEEFEKNYFFDFDDSAIDYLMTNYNLHIDIAKIYMRNLYFIDLNKDYYHSKLIKLKEIKQDLLDKCLIKGNPYFKEYLKNKNIIVKNYNEIELYLINTLKEYNTEFIQNKSKDINFKVKHFKTLEDEIVYTATEIIKLINNGVDINKILISSLEEDYIYSVKRIFKYFNIPINIKNKYSIYATKIVKDYLNSNKINLESGDSVTKKLVGVLNSLVEIKDSLNYEVILKEKLKSTYLDSNSLVNAVSIVDIEQREINDDEYVFVLGFNQDHFPRLYKDEDFIRDKMKDEVELYTTKEKNKIKKSSILNILSNIKNLSISYKDSSSFSDFYPSSLIEENNIEVESVKINKFAYSNMYNKLILSEHLDLYRKYKEESDELYLLSNHYKNIPYNTYNNEFTGIKKQDFLNFIRDPFILSYTSMNSFNLCGFKYYINNILRLDPFEDNFKALIGSLFHKILSLMKEEYFNFERVWDKFLEDKELSIKEEFFLKRLKKELKDLIEKITEQERYTSFKDAFYEKDLSITFKREVLINFIGSIDKLLFSKNIDDTYFSIIDYKTGSVDTSLNNMKYGLSMQLPIYLYLVSNSNLFESPIFTGMYFQKILSQKPSFDPKKSLDTIINNRLKLEGYSTSNEDILQKFDNTYEASEYIKSLKKTKNGFSKGAKLLGDEDIYNVLKYTDKVINESIDNIMDTKFNINPKIIDKKNLSCKFCSYRDICFVKEKDYVYLDKVKDLSFLEVE